MTKNPEKQKKIPKMWKNSQKMKNNTNPKTP